MPRADPGNADPADTPGHSYALCLGGPCHGLLTRIDQHLGHIDLTVPNPDPDERGTADTGPALPPTARYRLTRDRVHHPCLAKPIPVLRPDPPSEDTGP